MSLRAGLIGCGGFGRVHTETLSRIDGMDLVAFCDIVPERAERLLQEFGGEYATTDSNRVIEDPSLDAVYICTQHDTHAELCIRAAQAGKHVMVEKPLALTVEDCLQVGRVVEETGITLMVAFKMRFYELILKAKELMPDPLMVSVQMMDNRWPDSYWGSDPVKGGGSVLSQGCHSSDILRFLTGKNPHEVYAVGGNYYTKTGVVDNLAAVFRFEDGIAGNWIQGDANAPPFVSKFFIQMFSEGKSITMSDRLCKLVYREDTKEPQIFRGSETGVEEENRAFIQSIQEGKPPVIDHIDGLYATLMPLQALASLKSGRPEPIASLVEELQNTSSRLHRERA